ncbi:TPA: Gfo/Idh/MocA family oxidoreductase [Candidatus Bathyarchaeota archaeon]|nr:Gfo/Idh/MocA family oxidoreductase [Candidatus Bathyarchaeota archaeon]
MVYRVGILGLKGHQGVVLNSIPKIDDVVLSAAVDDSEEALTRLKKHPAVTSDTKFYTSILKLLEEEKIDIACVSGTDGERAQVLLECMNRGIHVLSEKPLTMTLDELSMVKDAYESSSITLSMLMTMRFSPPYRKIREVVMSGTIGEVCLANAQKSYKLGQRPSWQQSHKTFSSTLAFIGIHLVDLIRWCTGREFTEVTAYQSNVGHPEVHEMEDNAVMILRMDNGGSACIHLDYCRPRKAATHGDDLLRIAGNQGVIETFKHGSKVRLITHETEVEELPLDEPVDEFLNFVNAVKGIEECEVPAEDCFRVTEIVLKARESSNLGQPIKL